jgi:hypothetical protein
VVLIIKNPVLELVQKEARDAVAQEPVEEYKLHLFQIIPKTVKEVAVNKVRVQVEIEAAEEIDLLVLDLTEDLELEDLNAVAIVKGQEEPEGEEEKTKSKKFHKKKLMIKSKQRWRVFPVEERKNVSV